jgi:integrase
LGRDYRRVVDHAAMIIRTRARFRAEGLINTHWTADTLARVKQAIKNSDLVFADKVRIARKTVAEVDSLDTAYLVPTPAPAATPSPAQGVTTLYQAIDLFNTAQANKPTSQAHKLQAARVPKRLKSIRQDCQLSAINFGWIDAVCDEFKSRPTKKGRRPAAATVIATLKYIRLFFVWLDDQEIGWEAPRRLAKPFKVTAGDLMTPIERRQSATIKQFGPATLRRMYQLATPKVQTWILTALLTGGTQQELAVLERSEFDLDAATLTHYRNKTAVEGCFWLPPELVLMLRKQWEKKPGTLAFISRDNRPLVGFAGGKKSDAVRVAWHKLRIAAGLPDSLPFKYLRKYAADYAMKSGGEAMGQTALSHSRTTVIAKHYTSARDFEKFHQIQRQMHADLTSAGLFTPFSENVTTDPILCAGGTCGNVLTALAFLGWQLVFFYPSPYSESRPVAEHPSLRSVESHDFYAPINQALVDATIRVFSRNEATPYEYMR